MMSNASECPAGQLTTDPVAESRRRIGCGNPVDQRLRDYRPGVRASGGGEVGLVVPAAQGQNPFDRESQGGDIVLRRGGPEIISLDP